MPRLLGGESECFTLLVCTPVRPLKIKRASAASPNRATSINGAWETRAQATLAAEGTAAVHTVNRRLQAHSSGCQDRQPPGPQRSVQFYTCARYQCP